VLESLQVKVADVKKDFAQVHERLDEIRQRKQTHILQQAQMAIDHTIALEKSMQIQEELIEFEIQCIEAESELEHLNTESQRVRDMLKQREREIIHFAAQISQQTDLCKGLVKEIKAGQQRRRDMENGDELDDLMNAWLGGQNLDGDEGTTEEGGNRTVDDLDADILSTRQRIELLHEGNPRALEQFEQRARDIERMKNQIANFQETLHKLNKTIDELRQKWEPELDGLVERISAAFAHNFERIGCAGQVSVRKDETDFREWAIQIEVKFR
jgi:chromosome segregation ATPase